MHAAATSTKPSPGQPRAGARPIEVVASVLPSDYARFGEQVAMLGAAGVDRIQWDIMDGNFVPNLSFGPDVIAASRSFAAVPFEAHLMVDVPDLLAPLCARAGCDVVIIHAETSRHLHRSLHLAIDSGARAGVAINPATPVESIVNVLDLVDLVLVMTVNPGFGGQRYLASMEPKIAAVRRAIEAGGREIDIEVDGGVDVATIGGARAAGANLFVVGSALFRDAEGMRHAVESLRAAAGPAALPS
jgi:ribulose-phosphate 3-epimerase